jgi:deazaflavin-dependent oxidoreductase (nitroreductase family)
VPGDDYCYVTTTGRRTGRPHRIEIWYARDGGTLYLLAGGRHTADWVRNIVADPGVVVELDELGDQQRHGGGRILDDGDEADRARSLVFAKYAPRSSSDLTGWRDRALPVAIDLDPS